MDSVIHLLNKWGPDLQIRWGGGGRSQKTFFQPFGLQFGLKIRRGGRSPRALTKDSPLSLQVKPTREKNVFSQTHLIGVVRAGYKSKQLCQGMGCRIGYLPFFCTCRWN